MKTDSDYPEPFNPHPGKFYRGDMVIDKKGCKMRVLGPEDFDGYVYNRPGDKWELVEPVEGHAVVNQRGQRMDSFWTSSLWIKKI